MEVPLGNSPWYAFYQRQPYVNYNISRRYDLYCNPFYCAKVDGYKYGIVTTNKKLFVLEEWEYTVRQWKPPQ